MQLAYWALAIALATGGAYWVYKADKRRAVPLPWLTALLRGLVVFAAMLLLLMPDVVINRYLTEKPILFVLNDNSQSAGVALGKDSATYRNALEGLLAKLSDKFRVVKRGLGAQLREDSTYIYDRPVTNISNALGEAEEYYGPDNGGAILVASDGLFNQGENPVLRNTSFEGPVYTIAFGDSTRERDLRIARTYANKTAALNSVFEIKADVIAELCRGFNGAVTLSEGAETIGTVALPINGDRFDRTVAFAVKATKAGLHHYVLQLPDAGNELNLTNNKRDIFVDVTDEHKRILIAYAAPHPDIKALSEALSSSGTYELSVRDAGDFPSSLAEYDAIILHGLPSGRNRIETQVANSGKPFWIIITQNTDITAVNSLKSLTRTGVAGTGIRDATLTLHSTFNAFTLPQKIQTVADKLPPMAVSVSNILGGPGANVLFTMRTPAGIMPAWMLQYTTLPTAMLAGEGLWRWRLYEYKNTAGHEVIDECIRQTVAFLCTNNKEKPFGVTLPRQIWSDQEPVSLNAYLLNANREQINTADVTMTITDSAGHKDEYTMERSGTGYNLNTGIRAGGRYTYLAKTTINGKELTSSGSFVVESVPLELMSTRADYGIMYQLAQKHNGAFVPAQQIAALYDSILANKSIKPVITTHTETVPLIDRKWYFMVILLLAVAEWLLRKYWMAQ